MQWCIPLGACPRGVQILDGPHIDAGMPCMSCPAIWIGMAMRAGAGEMAAGMRARVRASCMALPICGRGSCGRMLKTHGRPFVGRWEAFRAASIRPPSNRAKRGPPLHKTSPNIHPDDTRFHVDYTHNTVRIYDTVYSMELFHALSFAPVGTVLRIMARSEDGVVTLEKCDEGQPHA